MENFNKDVLKWRELQSSIETLTQQMKPLQQKLKSLKDLENKYEEKIVDFMKLNNLTNKNLEIDNELIYCQETNYSGAISREIVEKRLIEFLKSEDLGKRATKYIYEGRNINKKIHLKKKKLKK